MLRAHLDLLKLLTNEIISSTVDTLLKTCESIEVKVPNLRINLNIDLQEWMRESEIFE